MMVDEGQEELQLPFAFLSWQKRSGKCSRVSLPLSRKRGEKGKRGGEGKGWSETQHRENCVPVSPSRVCLSALTLGRREALDRRGSDQAGCLEEAGCKMREGSKRGGGKVGPRGVDASSAEDASAPFLVALNLLS